MGLHSLHLNLARMSTIIDMSTKLLISESVVIDICSCEGVFIDICSCDGVFIDICSSEEVFIDICSCEKGVVFDICSCEGCSLISVAVMGCSLTP